MVLHDSFKEAVPVVCSSTSSLQPKVDTQGVAACELSVAGQMNPLDCRLVDARLSRTTQQQCPGVAGIREHAV